MMQDLLLTYYALQDHLLRQTCLYMNHFQNCTQQPIKTRSVNFKMFLIWYGRGG